MGASGAFRCDESAVRRRFNAFLSVVRLPSRVEMMPPLNRSAESLVSDSVSAAVSAVRKSDEIGKKNQIGEKETIQVMLNLLQEKLLK